jgi:hypothetical protein
MDMIPSKMSDFFSLNMCLAYYFLDKLETNKLKIMSVDLMCINSIYTYKAYLNVDIFDLVNNKIKPFSVVSAPYTDLKGNIKTFDNG